jgi:hypothetical protein
MAVMYDSAGGHIPPGATDILVYSDGDYAAVGVKLRAEFPNATFHTISVKGEVVAQWIDVEPGCVWPISTAAWLWSAWMNRGCQGFYVAKSNQPALEAVVGPAGGSPEYFDANWTNVAHVDAGDVATQYESTPYYDISLTTPAFENQPTVPAPPPVTALSGAEMFILTTTTPGQITWYWSGSALIQLGTPAQVAAVEACGVPVKDLPLAQYQAVVGLLG